MIRALLRLVIVLVIVVGAAAFFLGWWGSSRVGSNGTPAPAVGTSGQVDTQKAREVGAEVGAKTAQAANRAGEVLSEGAMTAKIKSKMGLDDVVQARTIDVTTSGHVVTLSGTVRSAAERIGGAARPRYVRRHASDGSAGDRALAGAAQHDKLIQASEAEQLSRGALDGRRVGPERLGPRAKARVLRSQGDDLGAQLASVAPRFEQRGQAAVPCRS